MTNSQDKKCSKCNCKCHCYVVECPTCANDICYVCKCKDDNIRA